MKLIYALIAVLFLSTGCSTMADLGVTCKGVAGIAWDHRTGDVFYALPKSPAEKAGVLPEDKLINSDKLKGRPGEDRVLTWMHGDVKRTQIITLVCVDDLDDVNPNRAKNQTWADVQKAGK